VDFTTVVVIFFITGFLPISVGTFVFLGSTAASCKRSEAFCFHVPPTMSAGFSASLILKGIGVA
jgi:hypothetical protein